MKLACILAALAIFISLAQVDAKSPAARAAKAEAKAEKKQAKQVKKSGKQAKHLVKDRVRISRGEAPQHHEVGSNPYEPSMGQGQSSSPYEGANPDMGEGTRQAYTECVESLRQRIEQKELEQKKHQQKDADRIASGEAPEHTDETSMTKDYLNDPKFDISRICGPPPWGQASVVIPVIPSDGQKGNVAVRPNMVLYTEADSPTALWGLASLAFVASAAAAYVILPHISGARGTGEDYEVLLAGSEA